MTTPQQPSQASATSQAGEPSAADTQPQPPEPSGPGATIAERAAAAPAPVGKPTAGVAPVVSHGMFGSAGTGDTSGFGGLIRRARPLISSPQPWGGWFDDAYAEMTRAVPGLSDAVEVVTSHRGELTLQLDREGLLPLLRALRDEPALSFELLSMVSGVDYPDDVTGRRLHVVYHLLSMTHNRRMRVEVALTFEDPHVPSCIGIYPTADWHERETWDMFGVEFDGHPSLTRILMPDDWDGHPQRKDYPLGGIAVEYVDATVPPPDQRRSYA